MWSSLPSIAATPGVYWFKQDSQILYVGKAKNLKRRLSSYRLSRSLLPKTKALILQSNSVNYSPVKTEVEAILIESELIKLYQPHYNLIAKDDRSSAYSIVVNFNSKIPKVAIKPYLLAQKGISKNQSLIGPYKTKRDAIQVLQFTRQLYPFCTRTSHTSLSRPCLDFHLGLCPGICASLVTPTFYRHQLARMCRFLTHPPKDLKGKLRRTINQYSQKQQFESAQRLKLLYNQLYQPHPPSPPDLQLPNLTSDQQDLALKSLQHLLKPILSIPHPSLLRRIEFYDLANLGGKYITGAMVVMNKGRLQSSLYRHFKFPPQISANDSLLMSQLLKRRLAHPDWPLPNLIVIDGGKSQLSRLLSLIQPPIILVGLVKHPDRLIFFSKTLGFRYLSPNPNHPGFRLLTTGRNQAHRFCRRLHHHLSSKTLISYD